MISKSIIVLVAAFFGINHCAQSAVTELGLVDNDNSFVREITPNDVECLPIEVKKTSGDFYKLNLKKKTYNNATICEAIISPEITKIKSSDAIIEVPQNLNRVAFIGDTGCSLKNAKWGGPIQKYESDKDWPFKTIVHSIAKDSPDLVVHLGDYHYRKRCKDKIKCAPYKGTVTYDYKGWEADFIIPATELLNKTPFIFVRGNHEICTRAFDGYYKLIGAIRDNDKCMTADPTRYMKFGNLLIVNFDASNVDDIPNVPNSNSDRELKNRFSEMVKAINQSPEKEVWIVTHKPIWGIAPFHSFIVPINLNLQKMAEDFPLPKKVTMIFSGHVHNFQLCQGKHPLQFVAGRSGTVLTPMPIRPNNKFELRKGEEIFSPTVKFNQFGYLLLEKNAVNRWVAYIKDSFGNIEYTCQLSDFKSNCIRSPLSSK